MPHGTHHSVLLEESVAALVHDRDGTYVDGTFGRGGHARAILARLSPRGRVVAIDRDPDAERAAAGLRDARFAFRRARFSALDDVLDAEMPPRAPTHAAAWARASTCTMLREWDVQQQAVMDAAGVSLERVPWPWRRWLATVRRYAH